MVGKRDKERTTRRTVRQRVDLRVLARLSLDPAQARKGVLSIDVHGAGTTDTLTAGPTEGQRGVNFVLDLDESIENLYNRTSRTKLVRA